MRVFDVLQSFDTEWRARGLLSQRIRRDPAVRDVASLLVREPSPEMVPVIKRALERQQRKLWRQLGRLRERRNALVGSEFLLWLKNAALGAHVFLVNNATSYYWEHPEDQPLVRDFPAPIPPMSQTWFEGTAQDGELFGALLQCGPLDAEAMTALPRRRMAQIANGGSQLFVDCHLIALHQNDGEDQPDWRGRLSWTVNERHEIGPGLLWYPQQALREGVKFISRDASLMADDFWLPAMGGLFFALALLHCKNVSTVAALGSRQRKRAAERAGLPRVEYRTLVVDQMRRAMSSTGNGGGWENRFHICRGHFKQYDERPLFGRVKGRFWWPAHTRGNAERGVIIKQYEEVAVAGGMGGGRREGGTGE